MDRRRTIILVVAVVAALTASVVFRWRVFMAGGKWLVTLLVILALAALLWPRARK